MERDIRKRVEKTNRIVENNTVYPKFPRYMMLELTNICNHSCLMCANSKSTRKRGVIEPEFAERMLKEAYALGTREIGFHGTGEPLINKDLEHYISLAKKIGYEYVYFTTNGALFTKERAESIVEAGIDSIKFSINAGSAKDYQMIHGRDDYAQVIENILYLNSLREHGRNQFALYISYIVTRYTQKDKEEFQNKYQEYVDDILFCDVRSMGGMTNEVSALLSVDENIGYPFVNDICPRIFDNLYISYEGYLTMCCVDFQNYLAAADLKQENLKDAWNNEYACRLRKCHLEHHLEGTMCFNCIHSCMSEIKPLRAEYASEYQSIEWDKSQDILDRLRQRDTLKK